MLTPDIKVGDCVPVTGSLCKPPVIMSHINIINSNNIIVDTFELNEKNGLFIGLLLSSNNNINMDDYSIETIRFLKKITNYDDILSRCIPSESFLAPIEFIIGLLNGYLFEQGIISKNCIQFIVNFKYRRVLIQQSPINLVLILF